MPKAGGRRRPPASSRAIKVAANATAPPALAANIHSPAVSEIRKPRPSRRTPPGGVAAQSGPGSSVLQAIVGAQSSEPMPTPRPTPAVAPPPPTPPSFPPPARRSRRGGGGGKKKKKKKGEKTGTRRRRAIRRSRAIRRHRAIPSQQADAVTSRADPSADGLSVAAGLPGALRLSASAQGYPQQQGYPAAADGQHRRCRRVPARHLPGGVSGDGTAADDAEPERAADGVRHAEPRAAGLSDDDRPGEARPQRADAAAGHAGAVVPERAAAPAAVRAVRQPADARVAVRLPVRARLRRARCAG